MGCSSNWFSTIDLPAPKRYFLITMFVSVCTWNGFRLSKHIHQLPQTFPKVNGKYEKMINKQKKTNKQPNQTRPNQTKQNTKVTNHNENTPPTNLLRLPLHPLSTPHFMASTPMYPIDSAAPEAVFLFFRWTLADHIVSSDLCFFPFIFDGFSCFCFFFFFGGLFLNRTTIPLQVSWPLLGKGRKNFDFGK